MPAVQHNDVRPVIPDYDRIFAELPLQPETPNNNTKTPSRSFFSRHREVIWCAIIFTVIGVSAAALMRDSEVYAEPGCGSGLFY
jgi:hypothetical protein